MNPEQRFVGHRIQVTVELLVVFILQLTGLLRPDRTGIIDNIVLFRFNLLAVFPFLFLAECNRNRQEAAIFGQQAMNTRFFQKFLTVVIDIQDDIRSTVCLFSLFQSKLRTSVTTPFDSFSIFFIRTGYYFYFFGYHEGRIET